VDIELHAVELAQQVVRELDVGLVDLVDEQHRLHLGREGLPELAADDVVADVGDAGLAELRIAQARDRVVLVEAVLRLAGRLHMPLEDGPVERARDLERELGLAGAGFALDEQRATERDGGVDRHLEVGRGDVAVGAAETVGHGAPSVAGSSVSV
jgi:hypothetical protein